MMNEREKNVDGRREHSQLVARILADFEKVEAELSEAIEAIAASDLRPGVELTEKLDQLEARFVAAEKRLSEQVKVVPQYDLRTRQQALASLRDRFRQVQTELQPKKRFGFKGNKKKVVKQEGEEKKDEEKKIVVPESIKVDCSISDKKDETLELHRDEVTGKDVLASRLSGCTLKIFGCAGTLHLTGLTNCTVLSSPVSTSVFVDDCRGCVFSVACQQLRAHTTADSDFYLHVTSGAIVEDCNNVRFAPYALNHSDLESDYVSSGLDRQINRYDRVQDFNWLASDEASPNWSLIPDKDRKTFQM